MPDRTLLKALTEAGIGSRRRMADAIKNGRVTVNDAVAEDFRQPVDAGKDRVYLDGRPVDLRPNETICLMLNKPEGVISTVNDERGRRTVIDILPSQYRSLGLYPAGRLDSDSSGLLLLTNDGDLTYRLTHPRFEHDKEYYVKIKGKLRPDEQRKLENGLEIEDGMTYPAIVGKLTSSPPFNYSITIHEGRKRQVRRMFERLGHPVLMLKRVRIGNLTLGSLEEGQVRRLSPEEINSLLQKK